MAKATETVELLVTPDQAFKAMSKRAKEVTEGRWNEQIAQGVVNPIVLARSLGIKPQMVYNYIRNGKIETSSRNNTQKLFIELAEAKRFASEYMSAKERRARKVAEQLEANENTAE